MPCELVSAAEAIDATVAMSSQQRIERMRFTGKFSCVYFFLAVCFVDCSFLVC